MAERRTDERSRVLNAGKIVWNKGGSVLDCTLHNVSKTGAVLEVPSALTVPEEFELRWDNNAQRQHCMVMWRKLVSFPNNLRYIHHGVVH
jgi:hypothetical protein